MVLFLGNFGFGELLLLALLIWIIVRIFRAISNYFGSSNK